MRRLDDNWQNDSIERRVVDLHLNLHLLVLVLVLDEFVPPSHEVFGHPPNPSSWVFPSKYVIEDEVATIVFQCRNEWNEVYIQSHHLIRPLEHFEAYPEQRKKRDSNNVSTNVRVNLNWDSRWNVDEKTYPPRLLF